MLPKYQNYEVKLPCSNRAIPLCIDANVLMQIGIIENTLPVSDFTTHSNSYSTGLVLAAELRSTVMKHFRITLLATIMLLLVAACSSPKPQIRPDKAVVNGVRSLDRAAGKAEFSVSAFKDDTLLTEGTIGNVSATVDKVTTRDATARAIVVTPTANTCQNGTITSAGDISAILTLDGSGSMRRNDANKLRNKAAKELVSRMRGNDRAAVGWFSSDELQMVQTITSDAALLNTAIDNATKNHGRTNLWGASIDSINYLKSLSNAGNKVAVVFTDGGDTARRSTPAEIIKQAKAQNIRMFMIGLGNESSINVRDMANIASATNGFYGNAANAQGLTELFNRTFNAAKAAGCVSVTFAPVPSQGTKITGTLSFEVNGIAFTGNYEVIF